MDPGDKQCVLVFDEMTIKSGLNYDAFHDNIEGFEHYGDMGQTKFIANHAGAFMIRGLQKKWEQAIGYFLSSGPIPGDKLQILVKEALDKFTSIGLTVRAIICDQGSNNRKFLESLEGVCVDQPFFMHAGSKIHVIYDPPHLLKNVRNNLKKHGLILDGKPVLWDHIVNFYELDKSSEIRMAPKLTDDHIELPPFKPMRVNLAAQVFSHSVAAGIFAMSKLGSMSEEAQQTARFLEKMDRLFNACNSHSSSSSKVFGHAISDDSGHGQFLQSMSDTFAELTTCEGRRPPCFTGWRITIASILSLAVDINGCNVQTSDCVKLLGIHIDDKLRFQKHISVICSRASRQINAMNRVSKFLSKECKTKLYNAFILSNFLYCSIVCHFCSSYCSYKMEKIQKRALRVVFNDYQASYQDLLDEVSRPTLYVSRMKAIAIEMFKCVNNISSIFLKNMFAYQDQPYELRGGSKFIQPLVRTTSF